MQYEFAHDMFERAAARWPTATAIESSSRRLTYRELAAWADELGARLLRKRRHDG